MITIQSFKESLSAPGPPTEASDLLKVLWHDAKGDWEKAHNIVQNIDTESASWIHAYLHRKEGDAFNAGYWYNKAGKTKPASSLESEWESILSELL